MVHLGLGSALEKQGRPAEAEAAYRRAIELKPDEWGAQSGVSAKAYDGLGRALLKQRRPVQAEAACRKAIELQPDFVEAHFHLGNALNTQTRPAEAEAAYRKAIEGKPDHAEAHYNLGIVLRSQDRPVEAEAAYRKAIELNPDYAEAHCNLGHALSDQGKFADALASHRRGHELGTRNPRWAYPSARWVQHAERCVALDAKLPKVLKGEAKPADASEAATLGWLCQQPFKQLNAAAARFYADAFAAEPNRADDPTIGRYNAACAAALAGCGRGEDADQLGDQERVHWRKHALDWLRADLAARTRELDGGKPEARAAVRQQLQQWQQDSDFAGVRGYALAKLPGAERQEWQKLWKDVAALLQRATDR
jgi:tetratricopeptide (TPR) repeat protein